MTVLDGPITREAAVCRYCGACIRLGHVVGGWRWIHAGTGARRCDRAAETCEHCGLPIRRVAGAHWVHRDTGAFPCPEERRPLTALTYATPRRRAVGVAVAVSAEQGS